MMTPAQYRESLRDGRVTYLDGRRVPDVTREPYLRTAIDWVAQGYERFYSPEPDASNPMYLMPRSKDDLLRRIDASRNADITFALAAVVLALMTAAPELEKSNPDYKRRIFAFVDRCRRNDLRVCEAISDSKGDRSLPPARQPDSDAYVHVVARRPDGIVVRGCKMHITSASVVHEIVALPTKQMKPGEEQYAVAFAVPVNTEGVKIINTTYAPRVEDARHFPISGYRSMPEGFVIFDDVFVPTERVFLDGEVKYSALLAHSLGLWERAGGLMGSAHQADLMVGLAALIAEANGLEKTPHIRDKINEMIVYATMIRAGAEAAWSNTKFNADGMVQPDQLFTNVTKYFAAYHYHEVVRNLQDIAGALVITAPTVADLENPETAGYVQKYMRAHADVPGAQRMRLFHLIRDLTADAFGGWEMVTKSLAGGGMYAQRSVARTHYNLEAAKAIAREAAHISADSAAAAAGGNGIAADGTRPRASTPAAQAERREGSRD
jgi:4-hydroxybutyryl-CoA dehydratase/vinylacetyl-CoA-Delta-isomerase